MVFSTVSWFISVVVVGLLINIASNYLLPVIDNQLSKYFDTRRKQNLKKQAFIEREVARMLANPSYFTWQTTNYIIHNNTIFTCLILLFVLLLTTAFLDIYAKFAAIPPAMRSILFIAGGIATLSVLIRIFRSMSWSVKSRVIIREYLKQKSENLKISH